MNGFRTFAATVPAGVLPGPLRSMTTSASQPMKAIIYARVSTADGRQDTENQLT
jgi:hypothetical protein